jgi:putative ABC transport system permease protein
MVFDKRKRELDDELASHLRMAAEDRMERGEDPQEAEAAARRELGNAGLIKEAAMEVLGGAWFERLLQDVRYGLRVMRRNPVFALVSVLTLALGIGASTSIFSVVYGVLLRPLPYHKAGQIVSVSEAADDGHPMDFADPNFDDLRAQNHSLQGLAEFATWPEPVSGAAEPRRLTLAIVSQDFFHVMGVQPARGRGFLPEEQRLNAAPAVLISDSYWRGSCGSRQDIVGSQLKIGQKLATVIGVLPPGFRFPEDADVWLPRERFEVLPSRSAHNWSAVGRLKEGTSLAQARAELGAIAQRIKQQSAEKMQMASVAILPLQQALTSRVSKVMLILLGAVGFLLLVACANVLNLLLAQAAAREGELATRAALGASRARLIRQFLVESLLLCLCGGAIGVLCAYFGVRVLVAMAPGNIPRLNEVSLNAPVLLFALGLCCLVAVALGVATAVRASSGDVQSALMEGSRRQAAGRHRLGQVIIAAQLGVTLVLLVGAGLLGRSLWRVLNIDPGFRTEQVAALDVALPGINVAGRPRRAQFLETVLTRLRALPGVTQAGGTSVLPLDGHGAADGTFVVVNEGQLSQQERDMIQRTSSASDDGEGESMKQMIAFMDKLFSDSSHAGEADYTAVSDGYFQTLGIPLKRGRLFQASDGFDTPHVAVISDAVAQQKWPGQDPLGQTIEFGNMDGDLRLLHVVGVVGDVRERSLEKPARPTIYVNYKQRPQAADRFTFVLRTSAPPSTVLAEARKVLAEVDPSVPPGLNTFDRVFASSLTGRRFNLTLIGAFASAALLLAMIGLYGVMSYSVARRTREIGVRMALGAGRESVLKLVLGRALKTAAFGVAAGLAGALLITRLMRSLLFEVSPSDPLTLAAGACMLATVALMAAYVPARRATRVDPNVALRHE